MKISARFDCADAIGRLMGQLGVGLTHWRFTLERAVADRVFELIENNTEQPTDEIMWVRRAPLWPHRSCGEASGEERWRQCQ